MHVYLFLSLTDHVSQQNPAILAPGNDKEKMTSHCGKALERSYNQKERGSGEPSPFCSQWITNKEIKERETSSQLYTYLASPHPTLSSPKQESCKSCRILRNSGAEGFHASS